VKKGLVFLILVSALYWGYVFLYNSSPVETLKKNGAPEKTEDFARSANRDILQTAIELFNYSEERYPENLQELEEKGFLNEVPESYGRPWNYDQSRGKVE